MIAAYVDGRPLLAAEVRHRLSVMRGGPAATLLPDASTAEGRQLVRWLTQVAVTERVLTDEATRRNLAVDAPPWPLDPTSRVHLGGALSAALASSRRAVAAAHDITADVAVPDVQRQSTDVPVEELSSRWVTSRSAGRHDNDGRPWLLDVHSLPAPLRDAVSTGAAGARISSPSTTTYVLGEWARSPDPEIPVYDELTAARNRALARWVDRRIAAVVQLEHGFEHPGDISQPDHTHHH